MTKHRTITGFVAVALLAVAATAATMRSYSPWIDGIVVSAGKTLLKGLTVVCRAYDTRLSSGSKPPLSVTVR